MSMSNSDLQNAVQELSNRLATHIGGGDNAHLPADRQHSGFMTSVDYLSLFEAMGYRSRLEDGTDVFTLKPGHYLGKNLVNSSLGKDNSTTMLIDVYGFNQSDVQYVETIATTGQMLIYTVHTGRHHNINEFAPTTWTPIERYVPLWEGNISDTTTNAILSDTADKYIYLRITTDNHRGSVKKTIVKNRHEITLGDSYVTADQKGAVVYCIRLSVVNKNVTIQFSHGGDISRAGVLPYGGTNISLLKIEGVM